MGGGVRLWGRERARCWRWWWRTAWWKRKRRSAEYRCRRRLSPPHLLFPPRRYPCCSAGVGGFEGSRCCQSVPLPRPKLRRLVEDGMASSSQTILRRRSIYRRLRHRRHGRSRRRKLGRRRGSGMFGVSTDRRSSRRKGTPCLCVTSRHFLRRWRESRRIGIWRRLLPSFRSSSSLLLLCWRKLGRRRG